MLDNTKDSLLPTKNRINTASAKSEAGLLSRYHIRSLLAVLLGFFALLSIYLQNPLMKEFLVASVIIGCTLILDEMSEHQHININKEDLIDKIGADNDC